jgi:hypothetical protein
MKKNKDTITDSIITIIIMIIFAIPFLIFGANFITLVSLTVSLGCFVLLPWIILTDL